MDDARQLARFMGYLNSKLGREIGRLTGWKDKIWSRRYQAILISNEEEAQVAEAALDDYTSQETLTLTPLPCWKDLSPERYRQRIENLVGEIIGEAEQARAQTGATPLGAEEVCHQNPETRPKKMKKSAAPLFHAFRKRVRRELYEAYATFVAAFREAAERLRAGAKTYCFPLGSFPPGLPFVTEAEATAAV